MCVCMCSHFWLIPLGLLQWLTSCTLIWHRFYVGCPSLCNLGQWGAVQGVFDIRPEELGHQMPTLESMYALLYQLSHYHPPCVCLCSYLCDSYHTTQQPNNLGCVVMIHYSNKADVSLRLKKLLG